MEQEKIDQIKTLSQNLTQEAKRLNIKNQSRVDVQPLRQPSLQHQSFNKRVIYSPINKEREKEKDKEMIIRN